MQTMTYVCKRCYNYTTNTIPELNTKYITLGNMQGTKYFLYFFFPLNNIPSTATVLSAKLHLFSIKEDPKTNFRIHQYHIHAASELINPYYLLKKYMISNTVTVSYAKKGDDHCYTFDMKYFVQKWLMNEPNNTGFFLIIDNLEFLQTLSGVSNYGAEPVLQVTYQPCSSYIPPEHDDSVDLPVQVKIL